MVKECFAGAVKISDVQLGPVPVLNSSFVGVAGSATGVEVERNYPATHRGNRARQLPRRNFATFLESSSVFRLRNSGLRWFWCGPPLSVGIELGALAIKRGACRSLRGVWRRKADQVVLSSR